jgi:putative ubiquitin-RnfH superfamily antitoxin RatB of RatAB toxin-antitoxin module
MSQAEGQVEVVYARPDRQRVVSVPLRAGMTAAEAVAESRLDREFPELAGQSLALGIFGRRVEEGRLLREGDRVEIYRPLRFDPREARRRAAQAARPAKGAPGGPARG